MAETPFALFCDSWLPPHLMSVYDELVHLTGFSALVCTRAILDDAPPWGEVFPIPKSGWAVTSPSKSYTAMAPASPAMVKALRTKAPAFIHALGGEMALYASQYAALLGVPLVVTLTGRELTDWIRPDPYSAGARHWLSEKGRLIAAAARFIVCTAEMLELAIECGVPEEKLFLYRRGIDLARWPHVMDTARFDSRERDMLVVIRGRYLEEYGLKYGIKAFSLVRREHRARLHILGEGDPPVELTDQVAKLGLRSSVTFSSPASSELPKILSEAAVAMIPSVVGSSLQREFDSRFTMEAGAVGIPVVATCHGSNADTVEDGVTGYLVPERDIFTLADRVSHLLEQPDLAAQFAFAARAKMEFQFEISRQCKTLEGFFRLLLA